MFVCGRRIQAGVGPMCFVLVIVSVGGCGVLGAPIPPEDVGVMPVIERQLRSEGLLPPGSTVWGSASRPNVPGQVKIEEAPVPLQPEPLPILPLRSVGTR
ncbi:MAG: hypothetical protein K0S45_1048 [Nitrospira sp.]|nr:hypothetical protein [Nitrospira sp.]